MADFKSVSPIVHNILSANQLLGTFRDIYSKCVEAQRVLERYQTDPAFKAEADHLFTPAQLAELSAMIANVDTLQSNWFANHKEPLKLNTPPGI